MIEVVANGLLEIVRPADTPVNCSRGACCVAIAPHAEFVGTVGPLSVQRGRPTTLSVVHKDCLLIVREKRFVMLVHVAKPKKQPRRLVPR